MSSFLAPKVKKRSRNTISTNNIDETTSLKYVNINSNTNNETTIDSSNAKVQNDERVKRHVIFHAFSLQLMFVCLVLLKAD